MFVRKRDPRYKSHLAHQSRLNQTKTNDSLAPSGSKSIPRKAPTNNTPYVEQEWQKVAKDHQHDDLEWAAAEGEDPEEWECVACGKSFKSEAAWDSHERSKKHIKEVDRLKREIMRENEELGLSGKGWDDNDERHDAEVDGNADPQPPPTPPSQVQSDNSVTVSVRQTKTIDALEDELVSEESSKNTEQLQVGQTAVDDDDALDARPPQMVSAPQELSKREKRKLREARKAQAAETTGSAAQVSDLVCCKLFPNCQLDLQCLQKIFRQSD